MGQGALIPSTLYLLAIVLPETPNQVIYAHTSQLLDCLLPLFETAMEHPPALRSLVQMVTTVLLAIPTNVLDNSEGRKEVEVIPHLRKAWNYLLILNLDGRPKVRHVAQEGIRKVLTSTSGKAHPFLSRTRDWVMKTLKVEMEMMGKRDKKKGTDKEEEEGKRIIWLIQGLRGWVVVWGDEHLSSLCEVLLSLPPLPHLTQQIYSLLSLLLSAPPTNISVKPHVLTNLPTVLDSLLASPPSLTSNYSDIPAYLSAISSTLIKLSYQDPQTLQTKLSKTFTLLFSTILLAPSPANAQAVLEAASDVLGAQGIARYCVSDDMILQAVSYHQNGVSTDGRQKQRPPFLSKFISSISEAFDTHALRIPYLLPILTALVARLRIRVLSSEEDGLVKVDESGRGNTAAEILMMDIIAGIADLRTQRGFMHKDQVDELVGMAIEVIGVEGVLRQLPLNIEPDENGNTPQPGRAHLLPGIRLRTTNDSLLFFVTHFRPLSERAFGRKITAQESGKPAEAKIWEVIVGQIWDCFPGFCDMPRDLQKGLTSPFLGLLTNLLYNQPTLLPSLLKGLSLLVTSTQRLVSSGTEKEELMKRFGLDQDDAKSNLEFLKGLAKDMVAVLLNVFSKMPRDTRGMVGDVVGVWTGIMSEKDMIETYNTVTSHLSSALSSTSTPVATGASPISHTMLDLLIIFVPTLPAVQATALFKATATPTVLENPDATVQKKGYRLLKRLIEAGHGKEDLEGLVKKLNDVVGNVGPGAQRDRLQLLSALVEALPKDSLHLIPELLSEAVLGTKELNEKARDAGFDLVVLMGHKMAEGGSVKRAVPTEDEEMDEEETVEANIEEYITMVGAGLTGTTPHMISASINALSRLIFEFKDDISPSLLSELISTLLLFLNSKSREIVKSALGFTKVIIVALPPSILEPHLSTLVPGLLGWVHDHKNHMKTKTVHIFERMIRRFGFDEVYRHAGEGDEKKVLTAIKKKKDRAKRRKFAGEETEIDTQDQTQPRTSTGNAFDDILYNSDSDASSVSEPIQSQTRKVNKKVQGTFIRDEGDEPMDLLSRSVAGGISTTNPKSTSKRQPGQEASHFQTDKSGRLIVKESDSDSGPDSTVLKANDGGAFLASQTSAHGAIRNSRGDLKFARHTKRQREQERREDAMDVDEGVGRKREKKQVGRLGEEFRAKRAGGDIKKQNGPSPYAYVSIDHAARGKKGKKDRMSLTNKKRGSKV
ncbi:hypothetical protein TREMEDRAFT_40374 [Tremella mesenterica DSM 1558]|uniref:uncharacterized protein n=1 Tax=Tremella mesenterica (strain ATCC 24925 / CBS 8224 / DSM 1558 / NBRC 9311 / NRRL Y-6157 / RJB 2259-6 / UBC 559-6) TaxID=578456 RepID=UPI0003F49982|nr:uncharacterized protein TREMEDRAFT_40374 [Tremella mesenterica DSM 1558]EIW67760.1 hypothetical protein TREMEDRAFT_40374 [Tremella mesenterica DSM 1558]